jgi:hypothetical protein
MKQSSSSCSSGLLRLARNDEGIKTWMAGTSPAMTSARVNYSPSTALVMMLRWISFEPP